MQAIARDYYPRLLQVILAILDSANSTWTIREWLSLISSDLLRNLELPELSLLVFIVLAYSFVFLMDYQKLDD